MKLTIFIIFLSISNVTLSQDFIGNWKGKINQADSIIQINFNVMKQDDSAVYAMITKPNFGFFCDSTFLGDSLHLKSTKFKIAYKAALTDNLNQLSGKFLKNGKWYSLDVFRSDHPIFRPQIPKKPYPYYSENILFENKADTVMLAGTLTIPDSVGIFPAVILISGSSPNNRDYESFYHKSFLVLADYLTRRGIAVLRYDDRGVNKSTGNFYQSTPVNFAKDIEAGINYLKSRKEIDADKIGLIGHSGGGVVASISASQNKDVRFIVLLASPGINLKDDFLLQKELFLKTGDITDEKYKLLKDFHNLAYALITKDIDTKSAIDSLHKFKEKFVAGYQKDAAGNIEVLPEFLFNWTINVTMSPYNRFNIKCNPADYLEKVTCPVLSLNGSKDLQVPSKINQEAIKQALEKGGNNKFKIIEMDGLNHSFQECKTCTAIESKEIEQTFSSDALTIIANWILMINK